MTAALEAAAGRIRNLPAGKRVAIADDNLRYGTRNSGELLVQEQGPVLRVGNSTRWQANVSPSAIRCLYALPYSLAAM
jgi:hypothetical protein